MRRSGTAFEHEIAETDVNGMNVRVQVTNRVVTLTGHRAEPVGEKQSDR
jgi:osmotically-inducible protein OsmY